MGVGSGGTNSSTSGAEETDGRLNLKEDELDGVVEDDALGAVLSVLWSVPELAIRKGVNT